MIHPIAGKPRSGKSLLMVTRIVEALTKSEAFVFTNMVIRLGELQTLLDAQGHSVHVMERVRILNDEEAKEFYRYHWFHTLALPARGETMDFSAIFEDERYYEGGSRLSSSGEPNRLKGTVYVIDEAQNLFPAGAPHTQDEHCRFYLTQHGKLNHTVFCVCQSVDHIAKYIRDLAQDFTYCRNHRVEKFGLFRGADEFSAKVYLTRWTSDNQKPCETYTYKLDLAKAKCYDTSAGVGMPGGGRADDGKRAKGIPIRFVWVGVVLAVVVGFFVINGLSSSIVGALTAGTVPAAPVVAAKPKDASVPSLGVPRVVAQSEGASRRVRGYIVKGDRIVVTMEDGSTVTDREGVEAVWRGGVYIRGERYSFVSPTPRPAPVAAVAPEPYVPPPERGPQVRGSWRLDPDGVERLVDAPGSVAQMLKQ